MFESLLGKIGLSEKEAQIYELLVSVGPSNIKSILFHTKLKRGNAYYLLDNLKALELVEQTLVRGRTVFSARNPEQLELLLAKQKTEVAKAEEELRGSLPHLRTLFQTAAHKPGVRFYEGIEGIKAIHREMLSERKEILAYVFLKKEWDNVLGNDFWKWYYQERIKNNISVRAIAVDSPEGRDHKAKDAKEQRETRLVNAKEYPISIEKNVVGNKVAFLSLKPDEQVGVLVENTAIAETERAIFELCWKQIRPQ